MILAADPPAVVETALVEKPAEVVVVSRDTRSEVLVSKDTPLPLIKAGRAEDAVLRQVIFLTSSLSVVRPSARTGEETLRWTYEPYLQRRLCFTSITGLFSCAAADVEDLLEKTAGEAPAVATADPVENTEAHAARIAVEAVLRTRAAALFDDDRRLKLDPMLKAAGVSIRRPPVRPAPKS